MFVVVVALAAAFTYEGLLVHSRTIEQAIAKEENSIDIAVKGIENYFLTPYKQRLSNLLTTRKEIPQALFDQDRETLYRITLPLFTALKRENKYLHAMNFRLPDGHSFLRMQEPKKYDDDLSAIRPMLQHVHKERNPLACYEIGISGAFYRIIQPVFYQGSYVGVLELGIDAHSIMESLKQYVSDPLTTFFVADKWAKVTRPARHEFHEIGGYNLNSDDISLYRNNSFGGNHSYHIIGDYTDWFAGYFGD